MQKLTENDFMTLDILNRLSTELNELAERKGVAITGLGAIDQNLLPTAAFINNIERNIDNLAAATPPAIVPKTKTWLGLGEGKDEKWLDYNDVNRWFESLAIIRGAL